MRFYDQYTHICNERGIEPCSQRAASMFGVTRSTISQWNSKNKIPMGETVRTIANALGVSADYLLCRTNDPTDYSRPDLISETTDPVSDEFSRNAEKAAAYHNAVAEDVKKTNPKILDLYSRLDATDKIRVEAYMEGMLTGNKYAYSSTKKVAML